MTGQNIEIRNDDHTTHNIHPTPKDNREWNESQPPKAAPIEKNFAREEIMLPVKCNQHPWMKMYVNVVKSPFFAVTGADGKYEIKGLPPGDYTLAFRPGKAGRADAESHTGRQRQQDRRPGLQSRSKRYVTVAPPSRRLSGGRPAHRPRARCPRDSRHDAGATRILRSSF